MGLFLNQQMFLYRLTVYPRHNMLVKDDIYTFIFQVKKCSKKFFTDFSFFVKVCSKERRITHHPLPLLGDHPTDCQIPDQPESAVKRSKGGQRVQPLTGEEQQKIAAMGWLHGLVFLAGAALISTGKLLYVL
jgi:hypothetical protein